MPSYWDLAPYWVAAPLPSIEFVIKKIIIKTVFADNRFTGKYHDKLSFL